MASGRGGALADCTRLYSVHLFGESFLTFRYVPLKRRGDEYRRFAFLSIIYFMNNKIKIPDHLIAPEKKSNANTKHDVLHANQAVANGAWGGHYRGMPSIPACCSSGGGSDVPV